MRTQVLGLDIVQATNEAIQKMTRMCLAQSRQKSYVNVR